MMLSLKKLECSDRFHRSPYRFRTTQTSWGPYPCWQQLSNWTQRNFSLRTPSCTNPDRTQLKTLTTEYEVNKNADYSIVVLTSIFLLALKHYTFGATVAKRYHRDFWSKYQVLHMDCWPHLLSRTTCYLWRRLWTIGWVSTRHQISQAPLIT